MKKILLVGKFNAILEDINMQLAKYFSIQVCVDKADMVNGMLKLKRPDLVVISMSEMNQEHRAIFDSMRMNYADIPVVCLGTTQEQACFKDFLEEKQFHKLTSPVGNAEVVEKITEILCLQWDAEQRTYKSLSDEKKCILIVDDNATQLRILNEIIKDQYEVRMATSGRKALTLIEKRVPDLIFLDYEMPEWDGKMTLQMIREMEEAKDVPVVFLTGVQDSEHVKEIANLDAAGYLLKPAGADLIFKIIERYIR